MIGAAAIGHGYIGNYRGSDFATPQESIVEVPGKT
jgi:hypothetical protein